jgi:large subunit ribosomal protein L5e
MPFSKLQKNDAYFSRFQTKFRRRREGKTDYYARKRLVAQAKNKYGAPKYRLVVRITNSQIICQIASATLEGDVILSSATSKELPKYGIKHGLTNWSAAYATGLLVARRALQKLGLDEKYQGVEAADGTYSLTEAVEDGGRPFKVNLDVGLRRTSTGARVFGALKGASDGGLYIPHSEKRYPGYDQESKELDAEVLRKYIFGGHVAEYMETLMDDDEERYKEQFASYIEDDIDADGLEEIYEQAHAKIRADPKLVPTEKKSVSEYKAETRKHRLKKQPKEERIRRIQEKIAELAS